MGVDGSFMHTMLTGFSRSSAYMWGGGGSAGEDPQETLTGKGGNKLFSSLLMGLGSGKRFSQNDCAVCPDFHKPANEYCDEVETGPDLHEAEGDLSAAKRGSVLCLVMAPTKTDGLDESDTQYSYYDMSECKNVCQNEGAEPAITLGEESGGCDKKNENGLTRAWPLTEPAALATNEGYHRNAASKVTMSNENIGSGGFVVTGVKGIHTEESAPVDNEGFWSTERAIDDSEEGVLSKKIAAGERCGEAAGGGDVSPGNRKQSAKSGIDAPWTVANEIESADAKKSSREGDRHEGERVREIIMRGSAETKSELRISGGKEHMGDDDIMGEGRGQVRKAVYAAFDPARDSLDTNTVSQGENTIEGDGHLRNAITVNQLNKQESVLIRNSDISPRSGNGITGFESAKPLESGILDQMVNNAVLSLKRDQPEIVIQLKPEALGKMKMRVSSDDHHVSIRIVTETAAARDLIDNSCNQLKSALHDQGLDIEEFQVWMADDFEGTGREFENEKQFNVGGGSGEGEIDARSFLDSDETDEGNEEGMRKSLVNCFA